MDYSKLSIEQLEAMQNKAIEDLQSCSAKASADYSWLTVTDSFGRTSQQDSRPIIEYYSMLTKMIIQNRIAPLNHELTLRKEAMQNYG